MSLDDILSNLGFIAFIIFVGVILWKHKDDFGRWGW